MADILHKTSVDLSANIVPNKMHFVQHDNGIAVIEISVYDEYQPYAIPSAKLKWNGVEYNPDSYSTDRTKVYFTITSDMSAKNGQQFPVLEILGTEIPLFVEIDFKEDIDEL